MNVERLIQKAQQGDARAFARLYDAYFERIFGFVRTRVSDLEDAKDLTATVFMRAWEALPSYDLRGVPFAAWLFRIARNAIIDEYRRTARGPQQVWEDDAQAVADPVSVEETVIAQCDAETVRRALEALTDEQAAVIVLRFLWDMPIAEVAEALGKSEGAVKAMQHRAVRMLAKHLAEQVDDEA
ncbi:sigma-70 family RNA polymerase sigma factor [Coriobacteriia bacterium Es71-Z0120]|uniref:RNA polymerase sigma factor n=1 Tax=Parvivirga hydrogeniphila TaxID=2939460 RepID=UPI002260867D|nr:sigma-70 family RNA polymerase sigma factor [Parvivirga hydrogeniphila]MCL4078482.1 sigma-70 family RNA polymerase sigma factor [Parvivirga hydrogeniphila]